MVVAFSAWYVADQDSFVRFAGLLAFPLIGIFCALHSGDGLNMSLYKISLAFYLLAVCVFFGVEWLSKRKDMREDSAIAVFWTFGMAVGIIFSFLAPGFTPDLSAFLFGNILTITPADISLLAILTFFFMRFVILLDHSRFCRNTAWLGVRIIILAGFFNLLCNTLFFSFFFSFLFLFFLTDIL